MVNDALTKNIISKDETQLLVIAEKTKLEAIKVDDFSVQELVG